MASTGETRTDEYRDQAAECLDSARTVAGAKAKLELLALAKGYLDLADLVEASANENEMTAPSRELDNRGRGLPDCKAETIKSLHPGGARSAAARSVAPPPSGLPQT